MEIFSKNTESSCSATKEILRALLYLQLEQKFFLETPLTVIKASDHRTIDLNARTFSVVHTYHPDITEPVNFCNYEDLK